MEETIFGLLEREEQSYNEYGALLSAAESPTERQILERVLIQKKFQCESLRLLASAKIPERFIAFGTVVDNEVNFREEPNSRSSLVSLLSSGTPVIIMENRGNWTGVQLYDGTQGWVFKDYVKVSI